MHTAYLERPKVSSTTQITSNNAMPSLKRTPVSELHAVVIIYTRLQPFACCYTLTPFLSIVHWEGGREGGIVPLSTKNLLTWLCKGTITRQYKAVAKVM